MGDNAQKGAAHEAPWKSDRPYLAGPGRALRFPIMKRIVLAAIPWIVVALSGCYARERVVVDPHRDARYDHHDDHHDNHHDDHHDDHH